MKKLLGIIFGAVTLFGFAQFAFSQSAPNFWRPVGKTLVPVSTSTFPQVYIGLACAGGQVITTSASGTAICVTDQSGGNAPDADATTRGFVSTGTQTFGGRKFFDYVGVNGVTALESDGGDLFLATSSVNVIVPSSSQVFFGNTSGPFFGLNGTNFEISSGNGLIFDLTALSGDKTAAFQNKNGTVAYLDDITGGGGGVATTSPFTAGFHIKASSSLALTNSNIFEDSSGNIGIGTTQPSSTLHVVGTERVTGTLNVSSTSFFQGVMELRAALNGLSATLTSFLNVAGALSASSTGAFQGLLDARGGFIFTNATGTNITVQTVRATNLAGGTNCVDETNGLLSNVVGDCPTVAGDNTWTGKNTFSGTGGSSTVVTALDFTNATGTSLKATTISSTNAIFTNASTTNFQIGTSTSVNGFGNGVTNTNGAFNAYGYDTMVCATNGAGNVGLTLVSGTTPFFCGWDGINGQTGGTSTVIVAMHTGTFIDFSFSSIHAVVGTPATSTASYISINGVTTTIAFNAVNLASSSLTNNRSTSTVSTSIPVNKGDRISIGLGLGNIGTAVTSFFSNTMMTLRWAP